MGEYNGEVGKPRVEVSVNKGKKTITISDEGIGMTAEEIKKYINQIAFSGANEFVEKFKDEGDANEMIGKFGLGFYTNSIVIRRKWNSNSCRLIKARNEVLTSLSLN